MNFRQLNQFTQVLGFATANFSCANQSLIVRVTQIDSSYQLNLWNEINNIKKNCADHMEFKFWNWKMSIFEENEKKCYILWWENFKEKSNIDSTFKKQNRAKMQEVYFPIDIKIYNAFAAFMLLLL